MRPTRGAALVVALALAGCVTSPKKSRSATKAAPEPAIAEPAAMPSDVADPALDARITQLGESIVIQANAENLKAVAAEARMTAQITGNVPLAWDGFARRFEADIEELEAAVRAVEAAPTPDEVAARLTAAAGPVTRVETVSRMLASYRDGDALATALYFAAALRAGSAAASGFFEANLVSGEGLSPKVRKGLVPALRALAERGDATAQYTLATVFLVGKLTPKSAPKAAALATRAAEQGSPEGQYLLGLLYLEGSGVKKDPKLAAQWLNRAAAQGNEGAKSVLAELAR